MNFITKTLTTVLAVSTIVATAPGAQAGSFRDNAESQQGNRDARAELCKNLLQNAPVSLDSGEGAAYQLQDGTVLRVDMDRAAGYDYHGNRILDCKVWKFGVVDQVSTYVHDYGQITWELGWNENTNRPESAPERWTLNSYTAAGVIHQVGNLRYGRSVFDQKAQEGLNQIRSNFRF